MEKEFHRGKLVRMVANHCGHGHRIGEVVKIKKAKEIEVIDGYWQLESDKWVFASDDCEPINQKRGAF